ncbi:MAG: hypothetical protein AAF098_11265 [Pseudomonadota bacterium]
MYQSLSHSNSQKISAVFFFAVSAIVTVALLSPSAFAEIYPRKQPQLLRQAERALERNQPESALRLAAAQRARGTRASFVSDLAGLECRAFLHMKDALAAKTACLEAISTEIGIEKWRHLNNLGVAELQLGNYEAAEAAFARAGRFSQGTRTARRNLAIVRKAIATLDADAQEALATTR